MPLHVLHVEPLEVAVVGIFVRAETDANIDIPKARHRSWLKNLCEPVLSASGDLMEELINLIAEHVPHAEFKPFRINAFVQRIGLAHRLLDLPSLQSLRQL